MGKKGRRERQGSTVAKKNKEGKLGKQGLEQPMEVLMQEKVFKLGFKRLRKRRSSVEGDSHLCLRESGKKFR